MDGVAGESGWAGRDGEGGYNRKTAVAAYTPRNMRKWSPVTEVRVLHRRHLNRCTVEQPQEHHRSQEERVGFL